jgi:DNA helicase-2/ATP-dependent DNA helicase PcrA
VREEDLRQLAAFSLEFDGTEEFLTQLSLMTNVEAEGSQAGSDDGEHVTLTTIHQAKGLEFDVVFLIMLCDGLFPTSRSLLSPEAVEEERRLFYVGITRARNELYLSHPLTRRTAERRVEPTRKSTFLKDLPANLVFEYPLRSVTAF